MDAGTVKTLIDATHALIPALTGYGATAPADRKPEDDASVAKLRVAVGAIFATCMEVARLTPPPMPAPPAGTAS
jgi:hypothetical protein